MLEIVWDQGFKKTIRKWSKRYPEYTEILERQLETFVKEPFHASLKTHALTGTLKECWSFRITYDHRLIFRFNEDRSKAILVDIGKHDDVY